MAWNSSYSSSGQATGSTSADATAVVFGASGDFIAAWVGNTTTTDVMKVTDNNGNQLTLLVSMTTVVAGQSLALYGQVSPSSVSSITASHSINNAGTSGFANKTYLNAYNWKGGPSTITGIVDVSDTQGNGTNATSQSPIPSITTTDAGDLLLAAVFLSGTAGQAPAWTNSFTFGQENPNSTSWFLTDAYRVPAATGTYNPNVSWSNSRKFQAVTVGLLVGSSAVNASITQVHGSLTLTGGTQSIATVNDVALTQTHGSLTLTGGTQAVTVIYTFGTTTSAGTSAGGVNEIVGTKYTLPVNGIVTSLSLYTPNSGNAVGAIYSDNAGSPNSLLVSDSNTPTAVTASQYNVIDIPNTALTAGTYWLVFMTSASNMRSFTTGGTNQTAFNLGTVYNATWPSSFPTPSFQSNDYIAYATYTPGANISIMQVAGTLTLSGGTQSIATVNDVALTQTHGSLTLTPGTQAVATSQIAAIVQTHGSLTLTGGTQTVASVAYTYASASVSQVSANLILTGGTQAVTAVVIASASVSQTSANLVLTGGTQTISAGSVISAGVSQTAATLTLTGGTQAVAGVAIVSASIAQTHGTLTLSGGTQSIATGSIVSASITQVHGTLTLTGGTQAISTTQIAGITQTHGSLLLTGGTQATAGVNIATIAQAFAALTLTGGTQSVAGTVLVNASITQTHGSLILMGGSQVIATTRDALIAQLSASLILTGGTQGVASSSTLASISQFSASLRLTGGTQSVVTINRLGRIEVYNGSSFALHPVNVWDGSTWVRRKFQYYDGTKWVTTL